ncbi:MAG: hypothetical protein WCH43_03970, partial [Verrucomicrobiota bacterium]
LLTPDSSGHNYRTGTVLNGGNISISGNIVAEAGAVLDVSGATGILDLPPANSGIRSKKPGNAMVSTTVTSNGGTITLDGKQELFTDATLIGATGGPGAVGGSLTVSSGYFHPQTPTTTAAALDVTLDVTQSGLTIAPASFYPVGASAIGNAVPISNPVINSNGDTVNGLGYIAADNINAGGFDSVTLLGTVKFSGPVTLTARHSLIAGTGGVIFANGAVNFNAPYVALGTSFAGPLSAPDVIASQNQFMPTFGTGSLTVNASLIDIGNLSLQGIGTANFFADNGDIRGDGTLDLAGHLKLRAGQIYPPTAVSFTIADYDYQLNGATQPGTVTVESSGVRQLPLSAGGELNLYASIIQQGGVLRAPIGVINLGWDGTGTGDLQTGQAFAETQQLTLAPGSIVSVSAVDPATGKALIIPYGINLNGISWINPNGANITAGGVPQKSVHLTAQNISEQNGATVDIRGGGDLYAYRWVQGLGGSTDILASTSSFAVIPGYQAGCAPFAPYNAGANNPGGDPGYVNNSLSYGDRVWLGASNGLSAGFYTLLPARYALLPGAFLVTPKPGNVVEKTVAVSRGFSIVPGYRSTAGESGQPLYSNFEVDPQLVVLARAEYDGFLGNNFLSQGAKANHVTVPRLPVDSGQLAMASSQLISIQGQLLSKPITDGLGGMVDIGSFSDIYIAGPGKSGPTGSLTLDSTILTGFGAASLLVGGVRQTGQDGTTITVTTNNITVDNAGAPLIGPDIILAASRNLTLAPGADVEGSGVASGIPLITGNASVAGSGNGTLLRVSSAATAPVTRLGVDASTAPLLTIGAGTRINGASVILDSTTRTSLDPGALITGANIALDSGLISLQLDHPVSLQTPGGLVLTNATLQALQASAKNLSLLSYTSIDVYGTGQAGSFALASLALHAGEIRGFNTGGGTVVFAANHIDLDNSPGGSRTDSGASSGTIQFNANTVTLGNNLLNIDQYSSVEINASGGILGIGTGGLSVQNSLSLTAPLVTGAKAASQTLTAGGDLTVQTPGTGTASTVTGGLGATLILQGLTVSDNGNIVVQSGNLTLHATGGDVKIGNLTTGRLDAGGSVQSNFGLVQYTSGGSITLTSDSGSVSVEAQGVLNVSAQTGGGNAGTVSINAPAGSFAVDSSTRLLGAGGKGGVNGTFSLDAGSIPGGSLGTLSSVLGAGGFTQQVSIRDRNDLSLSVDGTLTAGVFNLSADKGSIIVTGKIDASGVTGGTINLAAHNNLIIQNGATLTANGDYFNDAGKGGEIILEAGDETGGGAVVATANGSAFTGNGYLDLQAGSTIDLGVSHPLTTSDLALGITKDNRTDLYTGTLHLRAPRTASDLQVNPIDSTINHASSIVVEGFKIYTPSAGAITAALENTILTDGKTFAGAKGTTTAGYTAMQNRLFGSNANSAGLKSVALIEPGAEIINPAGSLTLSGNWDLSTFRFGPNSAAGNLTLRASGNLNFNFGASLSDGFASGAVNPTTSALWQSLLMPAGSQSWSYRLVSGADFGAADFRRVQTLTALAGTGSVLLGVNTPNNGFLPTTTNNSRASIIGTYFQSIRTGVGNIDIYSGHDFQILNPVGTVYTAGTQAAAMVNFDLPNLTYSSNQLGASQTPTYPAQYTLGGGNVTLVAQNDIADYSRSSTGQLVPNSSRELPTNWLYRRGHVDAVTGQFAATHSGGEIESTSWWVDFSNFFEGVGALGGGNVSLIAGRDISNIDAVIPTNARMPKGTPDANTLLELGGGDLTLRAGHDISGGVYYVERGHGQLNAGNSIHTNSTRAALTLTRVQNIQLTGGVPNASTWLPTTLFLGKGSFDAAAGGDLLLGPVVNSFLLPQGVNNSFYDKTYFSTYSTANALSVSSLTGAITLKDSPSASSGEDGSLLDWYRNVLLYYANPGSYSQSQPWLRLAETSTVPFDTAASLMPATLRATAFSGDINLVGSLTLSPSPTGTIDLAAAASINGMQPNSFDASNNWAQWGSSLINLSDANPGNVPGIASPLSFPTVASGFLGGNYNFTFTSLISGGIGSLFAESGATQGAHTVLQTSQALHAAGVLHANDPYPVHLYAANGDISGVTLFSGKSASIIAGQDITDIAFYIQNVRAGDISVVSAGRDIIAYDPTSSLRQIATNHSLGNEVINQTTQNPNGLGLGAPNAGDLQISGPGTLEVLAGRNLNL